MTTAVTISTRRVFVRKVQGSSSSSQPDVLSVEEPLEIRLSYRPGEHKVVKSISVTMRTPGDDQDLALGFLFTEGIITDRNHIQAVHAVNEGSSDQKGSVVQVDLINGITPNLAQAERNFYTSSSCGVCGKSSIQSVKTVSAFCSTEKPIVTLLTDVLYTLPSNLRAAQQAFSDTGGIHAAGLFTTDGKLVSLREDVGRHNALDKLIGKAWKADLLPLNQYILLLSGRASFELIQKAAMAGITIVAAIGAPSSLAVDLVTEFDITLIGFLKENRFNIYHLGKSTHIPAVYENQD